MGRKRRQTPFRKTVGTSVKSTKEPEKTDDTTDRDYMQRQMLQLMAKFQKFLDSESEQPQKTAAKQDQRAASKPASAFSRNEAKKEQKGKKELVLENINQAVSARIKFSCQKAMESYRASYVKMSTLLEKASAKGKNNEKATPQEILSETLQELGTKKHDENGILI